MGGVEDAFEVPLPLARWTRLTLRVGETDSGELDAAAQNCMMRRVARTELARMTGSERSRDLPSTTKIFEGEAGRRGRRLRLTLSRWTGAAETVADAIGDAALIAVDADQRWEKDGEGLQGPRWRGREGGGGCGCLSRRGVRIDGFAVLVELGPFSAWFLVLSCRFSCQYQS